MSEPWIAEESRPCLDPECPGQMEPEEDGDQRYWACTTCGYEGGYEKVQASTTMCAAGVVPQPWADPSYTGVLADVQAVDRAQRASQYTRRTETGWESPPPIELGMPGRRDGA